ncbi:hypothetical protein ES703_20689 [subsurface metagenome]
MTPGQRRLYSGDYNYLFQDRQPDGSVIVTVSGGKSGQAHRMHVRDLWGEHEEVLQEEALPPGPPPWIQDRLEEAGRGP